MKLCAPYIVPLLRLLLLCYHATASFDIGLGSDNDLHHFVTRPELKAPRFIVKKTYPGEITPGYWFVAPYAHIVQERFPQKYHQTCQTGPAIYDQDGELVWSGACFFQNQNVCDFRSFRAGKRDFLSAILAVSAGLDPVGRGIVLDNSFRVAAVHMTPDVYAPFNMHEFKVIENGTRALHIVARTEVLDTADIASTTLKAGLVINMGGREFDLSTGETTFEWFAHPAVLLKSSGAAPANSLRGPFPNGWDWLHMNAVDKDEHGDYLITGRYTDAIYKVSGRDGKLLWTLGGSHSDFALHGFAVSGPHDGRFVRKDGGKEYVTFLDNGGDEERLLANISTAYLLELDTSTEPWAARVVNGWPRPDGGRSDKRGNFQLLANGNAFVGWSENAYISEHHPDGRVLMEAQFASKRFVTYRSYLSNFTADPGEPPVVKAFAYGDAPNTAISVYYVSWNGATEVATWRFKDADTEELLGSKSRSGFETMYSQPRLFASQVYAEGVGADGTILGRSESVAITLPSEWSSVPDGGKAEQPIPERGADTSELFTRHSASSSPSIPPHQTARDEL